MANNARDLSNEQLVVLLSFADARQASFLGHGDTESAAACAETDQELTDEMARRGINADTYKKWPLEG